MGLFGDLFDMDGDGNASLFEELLGLDILGVFDTDTSSDNDNASLFDDRDDSEDKS